MSFDFHRRECSFDLYSPDHIFRRYQQNILYKYQDALDDSAYNESVIISYEKGLIKLDKKELGCYLQQFVRPQSRFCCFDFIGDIKETYESCVFLHLIHVFCIPDQEEKLELVKVNINKILHTCTERSRYHIFERYLSQRLKANSKLTNKDLLTGQINPEHEFELKLYYWDIFCAKIYNGDCKFLQQNIVYLVSNIERSIQHVQVKNLQEEKIKIISCTMLLCLLNWNICKTQNPVILQNLEAPSSSDALVADTPVSYSCTAHKVRNILQKKLSTLSKDDIFTVFNNYINKMYAMKSDLTEDDFCTGKIDPYIEFLLKFCYFETLFSKKDTFCIEFLRRNADLFVSQIELVVDGENKKLKPISCTILLCLLNLNMCTSKTTPLMVQNTEIQACPSEASVADTSTKYYFTAITIRRMLQKYLSTFSEDDIFTAFNYYLNQMYAMKSEITDDDFCTGKIEPYREFQLILCYCEKLCNKMDDEIYKEFLRKNADYLVTQIEEFVHGNKIITKLASCKILLHLLNWNICDLKSTLTQSKIQNNAIQEQCSLQSEERDTTKESCTVYKVRCLLQNLLSTLTDNETSEVFNDYIDQMYTIKSEISPDGLCIGETGSNHEYQLKLCYWTTICRKNDNEAYKKFIQLYPEFLVSHIKKRIGLYQGTKTKRFFCKTLLCILNWNICTLKTAPLLDQNAAIQASSSVVIIDDSQPKYSCTEEKIRGILQTLLSSFSEKEIFTAFNNYLDILYAINSEITEDDFCTGKIELYHEFLLKLCYCEKLFIKKEEKKMKKFLSRNADFLVSQIEEEVNGEKAQLISCKVLLCLSKWGISNQNTAYTSHENILSQTLTINSDYQDFINENALFFLSMVGTVMTKNNITVLIYLCDVLLSIPYNGQHFHAVIGAVEKLIRYYATQVGMNIKILEWIIKLRYRVLNENQKLDTAIKIETDFQNLFNLLDNLLTDLNYNSKTLERANNSFKSKIIHHRKKFNTSTCFTSHYHTEEHYDYFASHYHTKEEGEYFASHYYSVEEYEDFASHYHTMELFETRLRELWIAQIKCKVKATQISNKIRNKGRENLMQMEFLQTNTTMSEHDFIYEWKADLKENQLNIKTMEAQLKEIKMVDKRVDEMVKKLKLYEMLVLFMMTLIVMVGVSNGHHKSAKLKKYLSLKYEYAKASLYLLWCSGDIEVHPGPSLNKKSLAHDSTIERRWIQNISPRILIRLPDHEQSKYKPTKKRRNDRENKEYFKTLLEICQEEKVCVPKMYLAEINAWETMEYNLLHKLFVHRCEIEIIIASIKDFLKYEGSTKVITKINVSLITELQTHEIVRVLENYTGLEDKSQTMVKAIRKIAGISNTCAHGKYLADKWDGIWDLPLENWPSDILLFDPNNRGKYKKKNPGRTLISDKELVDTFLSLPQITFPQKYKDMVNAYKLMRKNENKQHKEIFCGIYKRTTSIEKIDFALKHLYKNGIFTEEVHNILQKWWNMETVETNDDEILLLVNGETEKEGRPHILINISTQFVTLTVKHTSTNSSQLVYDFPLNDELVPLKTMATTVGQTSKQKPSSDSYQKVTAKKYLTVSPKPDECPAANQVNLIIIPPEALTVLNTYFPCEIYPNSQAILESDIKHQHKISSQETALCSTIDFNQSTFSTNQITQLNQDIAISVQPGPTLCTLNQSKTNSDDLSSATKDSQSLDYYAQVSPTSDMGSSDSISSVNSESGNEERDQNNTFNGGQDQLTDSDYSLDSSNKYVSKTSLKQSETTIHSKNDSSMDNSTTSNKDMELLLDYLDTDLDIFNIDDQTFDVEMNALDNEDKNLEICDKDGNLMNDETQISNKNTTVSAYDTNVSTILEKFVNDMINKEHEKMSQMKTSLSEV